MPLTSEWQTQPKTCSISMNIDINTFYHPCQYRKPKVNKKCKCSNDPYSLCWKGFNSLQSYPLHTHPLQKYGLRFATLHLNDFITFSLFITLWPWVKSKSFKQEWNWRILSHLASHKVWQKSVHKHHNASQYQMYIWSNWIKLIEYYSLKTKCAWTSMHQEAVVVY